MSGASIEETLELWAASLREKARMRPLFTQDRVAASAGLFLDGLLGEERRKTGNYVFDLATTVYMVGVTVLIGATYKM